MIYFVKIKQINSKVIVIGKISIPHTVKSKMLIFNLKTYSRLSEIYAKMLKLTLTVNFNILFFTAHVRLRCETNPWCSQLCNIDIFPITLTLKFIYFVFTICGKPIVAASPSNRERERVLLEKGLKDLLIYKTPCCTPVVCGQLLRVSIRDRDPSDCVGVPRLPPSTPRTVQQTLQRKSVREKERKKERINREKKKDNVYAYTCMRNKKGKTRREERQKARE